MMAHITPYHPEGPCTQQLGTWVLGNTNYSTFLGEVYDYSVLVMERDQQHARTSPADDPARREQLG